MDSDINHEASLARDTPAAELWTATQVAMTSSLRIIALSLVCWLGGPLSPVVSSADPLIAAGTAWQLLDDGDPTPYPAVTYFDASRQRVRIVEYLASGTYGVTNGRPPFVWELVGDDWKRIRLPEPTPKNVRGCAAYDTDRKVLIVFGNYDSSDTWEYDGTNWTLKSPSTQPSARHLCSMSYDSNRRRTVMFGGERLDGSALCDTWEYDGSAWTQKAPASSPSCRSMAGITFDSASKTILLFGGEQSISGPWFNDTWTYDGTTWKKKTVQSPPPFRAAAGLVYDPIRSRAVLFGGYTGFQVFGDTWEWDGHSWAPISPTVSPSGRWSFGMAFDLGLGKVVGFGGQASGVLLGDTWRYDLGTWTRIAPSNLPPQRRGAGLVYDPSRDRVLLHAGSNNNNTPTSSLTDTWLFDGVVWQRDAGASETSTHYGVPLTYDGSHNRIVGYSGYGDAFAAPQDIHVYSGNPGTWNSKPSCCPAPDGREPAVLAVADPVVPGMLLFGGRACCLAGSYYLANDTWALVEGDSWIRYSPASSPSPRWAHAMGFDPSSGAVILQGGSLVDGFGQSAADTWRFDGVNWSLVADPSPPGPRAFHSMAYDSSRDRLVLFGDGAWSEAVTWEFDGAQWIAASTPVIPDPDRCDMQITYDMKRQVTWLFGGIPCSVDIYLNDTWAYGPDPDGDGIVGGLDNCPNVANANQANADGDPAGDACDCAPTDPTAWAMPVVVTGLLANGSGTTSMTWDDQAPVIGTGAQYDVATGLLSDLHGTAGFGSATCLASRVGVPSASDGRVPTAADGFYYLVRSRNACGIGSYGAAALEAASPCP